MLFLHYATEVNVLLWGYFIIYNWTMILIFLSLFQFPTNNKTMHSFNNLGLTNNLTKILIVALLSLAGVPPFLGFFSKLFIVVIMCYAYSFLLILFFFTILFLGLYFYIQNIRFLNSNINTTFTPIHFCTIRQTFLFYVISYIIIFFIIYGFIFIDDLLLYTTWSLH